MPTVEFVRLPNDHNAGTTPGRPTPAAYTADNDLSLGQLVDAVSHSPYWKSTAIFVTEDDAQNGPDHVDAHRTISQIISPYIQTGRVDSTFYSTVSMLRSIEDIVGIRALTQFDTFATPMSNSFTSNPNLTPYTAVKPVDAGRWRPSPLPSRWARRTRSTCRCSTRRSGKRQGRQLPDARTAPHPRRRDYGQRLGQRAGRRRQLIEQS